MATEIPYQVGRIVTSLRPFDRNETIALLNFYMATFLGLNTARFGGERVSKSKS